MAARNNTVGSGWGSLTYRWGGICIFYIKPLLLENGYHRNYWIVLKMGMHSWGVLPNDTLRFSHPLTRVGWGVVRVCLHLWGGVWLWPMGQRGSWVMLPGSSLSSQTYRFGTAASYSRATRTTVPFSSRTPGCLPPSLLFPPARPAPKCPL